jgi:ArsR family transcriptional regulator, arsenate/arsenite/antimonite-responsive transcriptional repressor
MKPVLPIVEERTRGERCCDIEPPRVTLKDAYDYAADFDILAHPVRIQLLDVLARHGGKVCVCDLEASVPVKQPTVSHHLKLLRGAGLIHWEKRGLWSYYFIHKEAVNALRARIVNRLDSYV